MADIVVKNRVNVPESYGYREFGDDTKRIIQDYLTYLMRPKREAGPTDNKTKDILGKLKVPSGLDAPPVREIAQPDYAGPSPHLRYPYPQFPVYPRKD